jgi:hypothetical protein
MRKFIYYKLVINIYFIYVIYNTANKEILSFSLNLWSWRLYKSYLRIQSVHQREHISLLKISGG